MVQRRKVIIGVLGAAAGITAAGLAAAGRASGAKTKPSSVAGSWHSAAAPAADEIRLTVSPETGKKGVSPTEPVVVSLEGGKLQSVKVVSGSATVGGSVDSGGATWRSAGPLAYNKTYQVTASILDSTGAT